MLPNQLIVKRRIKKCNLKDEQIPGDAKMDEKFVDATHQTFCATNLV